MADAKLNPRQLVDLLHRLDEIEKHSKAARSSVIEAMAKRSRSDRRRVIQRVRVKR